ncbi:MAG: hypothetical protein K0V04_30550 [Deltaproteobacteria bacterium]|nr:hypothetical protein [Deltaproteobacteria bacterium]
MSSCDGAYGCEHDGYPNDPTHEPGVDYPTRDGRYTLTIGTDDRWPPAHQAVRFELSVMGPADAGELVLIADAAHRWDPEGGDLKVALPVEPAGAGEWVVGPVELEPGVWRVPVVLRDDHGEDHIELRVAIGER